MIGDSQKSLSLMVYWEAMNTVYGPYHRTGFMSPPRGSWRPGLPAGVDYNPLKEHGLRETVSGSYMVTRKRGLQGG